MLSLCRIDGPLLSRQRVHLGQASQVMPKDDEIDQGGGTQDGRRGGSLVQGIRYRQLLEIRIVVDIQRAKFRNLSAL